MKQIISRNEYIQFILKYKTKEFINNDLTKSLLKYKTNNNKKALIWIHGFNDYYYHFHIGDKLLNEGYDIYALTLRRYGEVCSNKEGLFYTNNLDEYLEDIDNVFNFISKYNYEKIFLYGHSTGGLTSTIYCQKGEYRDKINGLILNAPFFDFNDSIFNEFLLKHIVSRIGYFFPRFKLKKYNPNKYNANSEEIYERFYFNDNYKLRGGSPVYAGWIYTINKHQELIKNKNISLDIPILVIYSDKTIAGNKQDKGDNTLDMSEINKYSDYLGNNVKEVIIKDAIHDVLCSEDKPRKEAIKCMFDWLMTL
jgi:alpha-beta hydrolase superfamily lysophospholipase